MSNFIPLYKKKKILFDTVEENCMGVEFQIGLETTREPKKRNSPRSKLKKAFLKAEKYTVFVCEVSILATEAVT